MKTIHQFANMYHNLIDEFVEYWTEKEDKSRYPILLDNFYEWEEQFQAWCQPYDKNGDKNEHLQKSK
jgi:hypothetical protein